MISLEELFEKNSIHDHYLMGYCIEDINIAADVFKLKLKIPNWTNLYRSTAEMEGWQREFLELEMLVEPEQVHLYEESESAFW